MNTKYCSKCGVGATSETKFCSNCGSDQFSVAMASTPVQPVQPGVAPVQPVTPAGGQAPKGGMPTWLKVIIIILVIFLLIGGCAVGCTLYVGKLATDFVTDAMDTFEEDLDGVMEDLEEEVGSQIEEQQNENTTTATLGSTFTFDDLEITLGAQAEVFTHTDETSAYNGKTFVKIPVTIKNNKTYEHKLKSFYYYVYYGETELSRVGNTFEDSIDSAENLAPGESYDKYIYFLCDQDGTYKLKFYDWTNTVNVEFDVTR